MVIHAHEAHKDPGDTNGGEDMAHMKKCPYCKGMHRKKRAYDRCKRQHKVDSWPK